MLTVSHNKIEHVFNRKAGILYQPGLLFFKEIIICLISVVVGGIYILCSVISMYDIGLTLHDIVLDSLEPIVVKNLLNSLAIISLSVTVLMQKLILRDVLLIPLPIMILRILQDCAISPLFSSNCLL